MGALLENVHAETSQFLIGQGEIHLESFEEFLALLLVHDRGGHLGCLFLAQVFLAPGLGHSLDTEHRRAARSDVNVRGVDFHHVFQKVHEFHGNLILV